MIIPVTARRTRLSSRAEYVRSQCLVAASVLARLKAQIRVRGSQSMRALSRQLPIEGKAHAWSLRCDLIKGESLMASVRSPQGVVVS